MQTSPRTTEESIILIISGAISICLLPFAVIRTLNGDTAVAILNTTAVVVTLAIFFNVYLTHKIHFARWGLSLLSVLVMTITIGLKGYEQVVWVYPALTTIFFLLTPTVAAAIGTLFLINVLIMIWPQVDNFFTLKFSVSAGATLLFCYAFSSRMRRQQLFLEHMATSDPLTEVGNRRALEEVLLKTIERLRRYPEQTCSLIMLDIDHFKRINDQYGHGCGDQVLKLFAKIITSRIRRTDDLFRFGGEEFVVVLENTSLEEARTLADVLREAVASAVWPQTDLQVTLSAGAAEFNGHETAYEWLARADAAMYGAKELGRNRCHVA
ncbi:GGDEF domain-containing protein [Alteromonas sp. ASW11-36]|uniref:diguanylate cyclase n=1 Tax=Alteromonas arenosi TaxID=3055817 RepID=A0ABT7T123_9ALTE|nr:GGDEF domain-containing protein [Alteromonas sp. ASW11-36]MDM7861509.1 GGDEF domain-containing protein [Alteromonas sp. ASW11-36]